MKVKITSTVNPRIKSLPDALDMQMSEMKTIADRLGAQFRRDERKLFTTEGSSGGAAWHPLSPAYLRQKKGLQLGTRIRSRRRIFASSKIMQRTRLLHKSLTSKGASDHIQTHSAKPPIVTLGTSNLIGAFHIRGGHNKVQPKHERDVMQRTRKQEDKLLGIVANYILKTKLARSNRILRSWRRVRRAA